ncbi:hypothetical protein Tco_0885464, partial [Tanacetum coccineum]
EEDDDEENVSEHEDGDDDERTESDNDGDDFVHPNDDEIHDANVEEDKMNEEKTYTEDEATMLYGDVNINLEGRDTVMTDAPLPNIQATQETEDAHVILTAPINPKVVDVSVTTIAEPPLVLATTLPPPPTPLIRHMQQTPFPIPTTTLTIKTVVQLQSDRLRDEAQADNEDFLNKLDENIKKIIKDQVKEQVKAQVSPRNEKTVNKQLKAEVMTRSTTESKTSLAINANLSELDVTLPNLGCSGMLNIRGRYFIVQ